MLANKLCLLRYLCIMVTNVPQYCKLALQIKTNFAGIHNTVTLILNKLQMIIVPILDITHETVNKSSPNLCLEIAIIPATLLKYNWWSGILGLTHSLSLVCSIPANAFKKAIFLALTIMTGFFFKCVITGMCMAKFRKQNHTCVSYKYFYAVVAIIIVIPRQPGQQYLNALGYHNAIMVRKFNYHHIVIELL